MDLSYYKTPKFGKQRMEVFGKDFKREEKGGVKSVYSSII
jgi:hypothetical protein